MTNTVDKRHVTQQRRSKVCVSGVTGTREVIVNLYSVTDLLLCLKEEFHAAVCELNIQVKDIQYRRECDLPARVG